MKYILLKILQLYFHLRRRSADLKIVKREVYCWYLIFYLKIMGDSEHINETAETIDMLIVSATEQLKKARNHLMSTPSSTTYKKRK